MRIDLGNANGIAGSRPKKDVAPTSSSKGTEKREGVRDTLSVSSTAQQVDDLRERIKILPSVRDPEVEAVRSQVGSGVYRPDAGVVAERLLSAHMRPSASGV
jgi:flagellar biosynthesis anti-sigma factor FlgM